MNRAASGRFFDIPWRVLPDPRDMRQRARNHPSSSPGWLAAIAALMPGCQVVAVDLGSNEPLIVHHESLPDAGSIDSGSGPVVTADCPRVSQVDVEALFGHPCATTCESGEGPTRVVGSAAELFAVTATRWRTCAGDVPWAADVVGFEVQSGCTLFLLHDAPDGDVVRGIEVDDQGTFDVVETRDGDAVTRLLEFHFPKGTWRAAATTSDCPHHLHLDRGDAGPLDFVGIPTTSPPIK